MERTGGGVGVLVAVASVWTGGLPVQLYVYFCKTETSAALFHLCSSLLPYPPPSLLTLPPLLLLLLLLLQLVLLILLLLQPSSFLTLFWPLRLLRCLQHLSLSSSFPPLILSFVLQAPGSSTRPNTLLLLWTRLLSSPHPPRPIAYPPHLSALSLFSLLMCFPPELPDLFPELRSACLSRSSLRTALCLPIPSLCRASQTTPPPKKKALSVYSIKGSAPARAHPKTHGAGNKPPPSTHHTNTWCATSPEVPLDHHWGAPWEERLPGSDAAQQSAPPLAFAGAPSGLLTPSPQTSFPFTAAHTFTTTTTQTHRNTALCGAADSHLTPTFWFSHKELLQHLTRRTAKGSSQQSRRTGGGGAWCAARVCRWLGAFAYACHSPRCISLLSWTCL
eukprot:RCo026584